jgi:hypothetical protein
MSRARRGALLAALATLPIACGLFIGLDPPVAKDLPPLPPPPADPCIHAGPPAPPAAEDNGGLNNGGDVPPFWLAVRKTYIGVTAGVPDAAPPGFDLDGVCSCDPRPGTAHDAVQSCVPLKGARAHCDAPGGVDNEFERTAGSFATVFDVNGFIQRVDLGDAAVLIYIKDYNGLANDLSVTVGFATADGLFTDECDPALKINDNPAGTIPDKADTFTASWRGCDKWHGVEEQFVGKQTDVPNYVPRALGKGFVRDGVLSISGEFDVPIFFNDAKAQVQEPIVVGPLKRVETTNPDAPIRFRLENAVLAGRLPLTSLVNLVFNVRLNDVLVCHQPGQFKALMSGFCDAIDSTESTALDFQGKDCQSMSFAFRFDSDVVDIDRVSRVGRPAKPDPCADVTPPPVKTACDP